MRSKLILSSHQKHPLLNTLYSVWSCACGCDVSAVVGHLSPTERALSLMISPEIYVVGHGPEHALSGLSFNADTPPSPDDWEQLELPLEWEEEEITDKINTFDFSDS